MKLIFLIFRNNFRKSTLGNFGKTRKYGKIIVISLSGRIKSFFGKILYNLNIGKFISIDGDPFLINKENSINLWFTGTSLRITKCFKNYPNNFVNMNNPIISQEKKIFQIFPLIKSNSCINKNPKIIFMGKIYFEPKKNDILTLGYLKKQKNKLLENFKLVDDLNFWSQFKNNDDTVNFENYRVFKTFLREKIIIEIVKNFKDKFFVYGQNLKKNNIKFLDPIFSINQVAKIYKGNLCLDTGSIMGSLSLYPRSIQILESGGLLLQAEQKDAGQTFKKLNQKVYFNSMNELLIGIEEYLKNPKKCNDTFNLIYSKFKNNKIKMEKVLNNTLYDQK